MKRSSINLVRPFSFFKIIYFALFFFFISSPAFAANHVPVATAFATSIVEDTPTAIDLRAYASDADGDALSFYSSSLYSKGTVSITTAGIATFSPTSNYNGTAAYFYFSVRDAVGASSSVKVSITVTAVNDAPVANALSATATEDTAKTITLTSTDAESDGVTYSVVSNPTHGTLGTISGTQIVYTPAPNYNGTDSFTYSASDASLTSSPATVSLTVAAVNDTPTADALSQTTSEDTAITFTLTGSDIDGDALTFSIGTAPTASKGSASISSGNQLTFTPYSNYTGTATFTVKAYDGHAYSSVVTITMTITTSDDAPIANNTSISATEDSNKVITLSATEPDGQSMTYAIVASPSHGTLSAASGSSVTYRGLSNYNGPDSFTFTATDSTGNISNIGTVSLSISAVNDVPTVSAVSTTTSEDTAITVTLVGTDVDEDSLTYSVYIPPSATRGTASISGDQLTFTPAANYSGSVSFSVRAYDGHISSAAATIAITITAVNDAPIATANSATLNEDASTTTTLSATDVEGSALSYALATLPTHGRATLSSRIVTYTPEANYNGSDSFTFTAFETATPASVSTPAIVSITINPVNDAPTASATTASTDQNVPVSLTMNASDIDGDPLTYSFDTSTGGSVVQIGTAITYTPTSTYSGTDTFSYQVSDGTLSASSTVSVTVIPVNQAPVAQAASATTDEDASTTITLSATDAENDSLSYVIVTEPVNGTASLSGNQLIYTPTANYHGSDSLSFNVTDGTSTSNTASISLTITSVNDAPVAADLSAATSENNAVTLSVSASDVDEDSLSYTFGTPTLGLMTSTDSGYVYTPNPDATGTDTFTYQVSDGTTSTTANISVVISAVNQAPVAQTGSATTDEDTATTITLAATDTDSDSLTYAIATEPTNGSVTLSENQVTYTPTENYSGTDSFTFTATDGTETSASATVTITVDSINDEPIVEDITTSTPENTALSIPLLGTDSDNQPLTYFVNSITGGTFAISGSTLTFTPSTGFDGTANIEYQVTDGGRSTSNTGTITVTITDGVNDAPVAADLSDTLIEDGTRTILLTATDSEENELTYDIDTEPTHGSVSLDDDEVTYTPDPDFYGTDSFTFVANDGSATSDPATVSLTINAMPEVTQDCDNEIEVSHVLTETDPDSSAEIQFFDNQISVSMNRKATATEVAELETTAGSTGLSCLIEQSAMSADELASSSSTNNREFGLYTLEISPQINLADLQSIAESLTALSYVDSATPVMLNSILPSTQETDTEHSGSLASRAVEKSFFGNIMLPGMYEYLRAYEAQSSAGLGFLALSLTDTGVCMNNSVGSESMACATALPGIASEFSGHAMRSGGNFIGSLSATKLDGSPQPAYPLGLVDLSVDHGYHGSAVASIMAANSNGVYPGAAGLGTPSNGILGGVHGLRYSLTSYLINDLDSYHFDYYYPSRAYNILHNICVRGDAVSNGSWGFDDDFPVTTDYRLSANDASGIERAVSGCPDTLYVFSAGNEHQELTPGGSSLSDLYLARVQSNGFNDDNAITVEATNSSSSDPTGPSAVSNFGSETTIAAPGYFTSYAAPIVSGVAGAVKAVGHNGIPSGDIKSILTQSGLPNADGVPFLDASAAILLAIHRDNPNFVPMTTQSLSYQLNSNLADLRLADGYTDGTHKETGSWNLAGQTLTIQRDATEEASSVPSGANSSGETDPYYNWAMESTASSTEKYALGLDTIADTANGERQVPIEVVMPKGANKYTLGGKFHAIHVATGDDLEVEDHAQSYCMELDYDVNQSESVSDGNGFHVPLARSSTSTLHTVPFNISGATLTGNIVKKVSDYWNPTTTYSHASISNNPSITNIYDSMTPPSCTEDVTDGLENNEDSFDSWAYGLEATVISSSQRQEGEWQCTAQMGHWETRVITPGGSDCALYINQGQTCYIFEGTARVTEQVWVDDDSVTSLTGTFCRVGDVSPWAGQTSAGQPLDCTCFVEHTYTDDNTCAINILDHSSPWAPEDVEVDMHLEATFDDVSCPLLMDSSNVDLYPGSDTVNLSLSGTPNYLQTFGYTEYDSGSEQCTATANVTVTTAYQRVYQPQDDPTCLAMGNFTRILRTEESFPVSVAWSANQGEFPVKDFFTQLESDIITSSDDNYEPWLWAASENHWSYSDSHQEQSPFDYLGSAESHFLPTNLVLGELVTPGFGLGMDRVNWVHGIGPVKNYSGTAGHDFQLMQIQKLDRAVH